MKRYESRNLPLTPLFKDTIFPVRYAYISSKAAASSRKRGGYSLTDIPEYPKKNKRIKQIRLKTRMFVEHLFSKKK